MSKFLKSNSAKVVLGLAAFAFAFTSAGVASAYTFAAPTLKQGSKGMAVMELQKALNMCADTMVSSTGVGSAGYESTSFGSKTKAAVKVWQGKMGLTADGVFGPAGRAKMNAMGCGTGSTTPPPNTQTGPVSAMLSTDNPAAGTLVAAQATADLAHFTFSGTGTVTNITLQRIGVSADATLSNVYLFDGATRLTDAASVSNNGMVSFNVPAGLFTVSGMRNIKVKSDILTLTSGQTVGVMLKSFATASGTTSPMISGNIHTIASATLASVTHLGATPSGATLNPGSAVTLWQDTLTISNRDVWMKRLALRNVGSASASAFQNFKLYVNGTQVGSAAGMDSMGYVTFDMSSAPVMLVSGSRVVRVEADIVSGASRTVQLSLRQAADVDFVDSSFGVNITPTSTPWAPSSASTISGATGGTLTIEKDVSSPSTNLTLAGTDVNLGTFKVTAYGEPIKIETLIAGGTFDGSLGSTNNTAVTLRNGRILINGSQYGSNATLVPAGTTFTVNYTVMPGTPIMVELHADIYDNDGLQSGMALDASDTILAKIITGSSNAQRTDSLGSFNAPSSDVSANQLTIATTSITLAKNATYANQSTVLPSTAFKIASYNLSGSSIEDINLNTLTFAVPTVTNTTFEFGDLKNVYAVVKNSAGTVVAQTTPLPTVTATGNSFNIGYTLPKNQNLTIEMFANLADNGLNAAGASFAVATSDSFRIALKVTGTSMTSGQSVFSGDAATTIAGQTIISSAASITASLDASAPVTGIVYDNQTITTSALKFQAVTAGYKVKDLTFTIADATNVSSVALYDGATMVASLAGAATVNFYDLNWDIPANTSKILTVKLTLGTVGIGAGTSGASLLTTLTAFTASSLATGVTAAGTISGAAGNAMYVYGAIPVITNVALPTAILSTGTVTAAKFTVASQGGTIGWKKIIFTVTRAMSGTDTLASPTLWDYDTNTQIAGTAAFTGSVETDSDTAGGITFVATNEQQISGTKTYVLKLTTAFTPTVNDNINVSIAQPDTYAAPVAYATVAAANSAQATFIWTDTSAVSHDATTLDWNNALLVKNLPTDTQTMRVN
ncbi:MAG: trimeric autotransporter adhesin [Candidatus Parcubacteria bacterium]|jgi:hypothetical protein